jgi:hypothetical protein
VTVLLVWSLRVMGIFVRTMCTVAKSATARRRAVMVAVIHGLLVFAAVKVRPPQQLLD